MSKNNRKVYLINPKFQLTISGYFLGLSLVNILIFYSCIYYFFYKFRAKGIALGIQKDHVFYHFLDDQKWAMDNLFLIVAIISIIVLLISGILISHRVAGPLYRFNQHLLQLSKGNSLSKVFFRKGDFFLELQDNFNHYVDSRNKENTGNTGPGEDPTET